MSPSVLVIEGGWNDPRGSYRDRLRGVMCRRRLSAHGGRISPATEMNMSAVNEKPAWLVADEAEGFSFIDRRFPSGIRNDKDKIDHLFAVIEVLTMENADLRAKLNGYLLFGNRHRYPYVPNKDGTWTKGRKSTLSRADYVNKIPPKLCPCCGKLFIARRADAKTCSSKCRTALHRNPSRLAVTKTDVKFERHDRVRPGGEFVLRAKDKYLPPGGSSC
jgi:predicted nucleic acid-binding Zn ribbon protein